MSDDVHRPGSYAAAWSRLSIALREFVRLAIIEPLVPVVGWIERKLSPRREDTL